MRFLAIALVIAGCARWQHISVDDVRSGRISLEKKWVEVHTPDRRIEMRSVTVAADHLVGHARNGAVVDVPFGDISALSYADDVETRNVLLGFLAAAIVVGGLLLGYVASQHPVN